MNEITPNEKLSEIIWRRLLGDPIITIAGDIGVSRQYIYSVFSKFPKDEKAAKEKASTYLSIAEEYNIALAFYKKLPPPLIIKERGLEQCTKDIIRVLSAEFNVPENEIYNLLCRFTSHHPAITRFPYYSNIERWKIRDAISLKDFAKRLDCTVPALGSILKCWEHMPLSLANKISECTGLTIEEIYSDLLAIDNEEAQDA